MAFKLKNSRNDPMSEINVTPFVDVMLVLLIIFMVTAPLLTSGIKINLPESSSILKNEKKEPVTISLNKKGKIFINKKVFTRKKLITKLKALEKVNKNLKIYVKADKSINYGKVMDLMTVINNAGFTKIKKFVETNIDDWNKQIDISLKGTIYCCHLVSKKMIDNQDGRIINIVGDSSRIGEANLAITAAARGGTIALGKSLAKEFGRYSITVNTISLGLVKTSHTDNDILEKNMDKILKSYPIKRLGKTSDVAPMVIFLSSKHAEWITGQTFSINGGYSMI